MILALLLAAASSNGFASPFTVTYNGNGSTGGTVPVDKHAYASGETAKASVNTGKLERAGFVFDGWNTDPNGKGKDVAAGVTFKMGSANIILYAK